MEAPASSSRRNKTRCGTAPLDSPLIAVFSTPHPLPPPSQGGERDRSLSPLVRSLATRTSVSKPTLQYGQPQLFSTPGQDTAPLRIRVESKAGPYFVGQGIELTVEVAAGDRRPTLELPRLSQAELQITGTSFQPISSTEIGPVRVGANLYITQLRVVARRAGTLELPPILARLDGQTGRSPARRLVIEPVPLAGRPAAFLGGVGAFSLQARVEPTSVRAGQEFLYRIEIHGPAAWGSISRPDLSRVERLPLAPRIEPLPDEYTSNPPSRTFAFRIRPTRAGVAILPPTTIAAFDPDSRRYFTRATEGLPIKAIAVAPFDPGTVAYFASDLDRNRRIAIAWTQGIGGLALILGSMLLALGLFRSQQNARPASRRAAQRFANRIGARSGTSQDGSRRGRRRSGHRPQDHRRSDSLCGDRHGSAARGFDAVRGPVGDPATHRLGTGGQRCGRIGCKVRSGVVCAPAACRRINITEPRPRIVFDPRACSRQFCHRAQRTASSRARVTAVLL